jgi:hypothetical protein
LQFYQYGYDNFKNLQRNDNIQVFFSETMVSKLFENEIWAVDGTFAVVPLPYMQLYTNSFIKNHHVFPSVFALFKNMNEETDKALFKILKELVRDYNHES